jgi:uncharacterized protein (TIGR02996 family)
VDAEALCAWLRSDQLPQRDRLAVLERDHVPAILAMHDDDHRQVVREIKKRLGSPKLASQVAALISRLTSEHVPNPPPRPAPASEPEPELEPEPANTPAGDDGHRAELEAALAADPEARDAYLVYGDFLEAQGDPFGALVAIGAELAKNPGHKAMRAAHAEHLAAHADRLLGPLATCSDLFEAEWHLGFVRKARLRYTSERFNGELPSVDLEAVLGWLLDEPGPGRFLQDLTVGLVRHDDNVYAGVAGVIARRPRPALRRLFLGAFDRDECELNWTSTGDLSPLWPAVAELRELTLRAGSMQLGPIHLPKLEKLATITGGLDEISLGHIAAASWPALRALSLHVGRGREGAATEAHVLAPLLTGERVPRLAELGIVNCELADELLASLALSPLLPRLTSLDVSMSTMSLAGVETIERNAPAFAHLALNVDDNYLPREAEPRLRACVARLSFGTQRDDGGDPEERYAAFYE